jgi:hypothetical protein
MHAAAFLQLRRRKCIEERAGLWLRFVLAYLSSVSVGRILTTL